MERDLKENPWKGLASYTYQDADHFYGRDKELDEIASIIKQNAFTTLYGVSGAGKTSIINAGLFPILDKLSYLPIYIRLDHNQGHIGYDSQIIDAVNNALNAIDAELEESIGSREIHSELDELWLYFHSHQFWTKDNHKITPIIFIDQFEEIFTKNDNPDDIWSFFNVIDSLQYSTPTERLLQIIEHNDQYVQFHEEQNFRMVFTMREDFLARLEDYSYNIPALRKNRIGLKPLNGNQALEVILKPRPDMVTRDVAIHIISKVTGKNIPDNARRLEATSVDTSILSLFCTELYNYAVKDNKGIITIPLVDLYGGNILEWFYDRNMQILPKKTYIYLENQLLTHSGFRNSVALENLLENGVQQEQLDRLAENRIIRIEDINHNYRVEFTHDVLCKIAKKRRDDRDKVERNKDEQSARRAFTIDTCIFYCLVSLPLLSILYVGSAHCLRLLLLLPLLILFYCLLVHRQVADKNISYLFWGLAGTIFGFGVTHIILYNKSYENFSLLKRVFGDQHVRSAIIVLCIIGIVSFIYALQYTRMSKETSFFQGIKNIFHFQAFTKYKSFKNRLLLITLIFGYIFVALLGIYYWDLFPFIACPILGYATLYVASKLSHNNKRHVLKYIAPIITLQFILLWAQYQIGILKALMIILPTICIAGIVFLYLRNNNWRTWKEYILPIICVLSIALLVPVMSLGYNFFNPKTWQYSRIYNGKILTTAKWHNFLKIKDSNNKIGVMDKYGVLLKPNHYDIDNIASVSERQIATGLNIPYFLDNSLTYGHLDFESFDYDVYFYVQDSTDSVYRKIDISRLPYTNRYSQKYISYWKSAPFVNDAVEFFRYAELIDFNLPETKERFISINFAKLFIIELAKILCHFSYDNKYTYENGGTNYSFEIVDGKWIDTDNQPDFIMGQLKEGYNRDGHLEYCINNYTEFKLDDIVNATSKVYKLFPYIERWEVEMVLDSLWENYLIFDEKNDSITHPSSIYGKRAYYRLFAKMHKESELDARKAISIDKNDINAYEILALSLYSQGMFNEAFKIIEKYKDIWLDNSVYLETPRFFGHQFIIDLKELEEAGILTIKGNEFTRLSNLLQRYANIPNYIDFVDIQNIKLCKNEDQRIYNRLIIRNRESIIYNGRRYIQKKPNSNEFFPETLITDSYSILFGSNLVMNNVLYESHESFSEPMLVYTTDQKFYYINMIDGKVLPNDYECAWPFYNGLAAVQNDGKIGFIDKTGQLIIPYKFMGIEPTYYFKSKNDEYSVDEAPTKNVSDYSFEPSTFYGFESFSKARVHSLDNREVCIDREGNILSVFSTTAQPLEEHRNSLSNGQTRNKYIHDKFIDRLVKWWDSY